MACIAIILHAILTITCFTCYADGLHLSAFIFFVVVQKIDQGLAYMEDNVEVTAKVSFRIDYLLILSMHILWTSQHVQAHIYAIKL